MSLAIILDREFRMLEQAGEGPFPTVLSQAEYLGMDKTYLSKLRNGATLTRAKASDMAAKLRHHQSAGKTAALIEEFLQAGRNGSTDSAAPALANASDSEEGQFDELLDAAHLADVHFIITATPAELEDETLNHPAKLNKLLLKRLGLHPFTDTLPNTKYCFLLPSEIQAGDFWRQLRRRAESKHGRSGDVEKINTRLLTFDDNECLKVYVVPTFVCSCPIVVFNPAARFKETKAFTFGYHENNVVDCVEWHDTSIKEWEQNFYRGFQRMESREEAVIKLKQLLDNGIPEASIWNTFFGYRYKYLQSQESNKL